jgi:NDP-sugar pyrophosphorylase family protein
MKAIILAAGKGERLGKLSNLIPKTMIKVDGKPILEHNIELCKKYGIIDIYINLHHLPHVIMKYFGDGRKFGVKIKYSYEEELLGTSGAVKNIALKDEYFTNNPFYVIYGDNYSDYNLDLLKSDSIATIAFNYKEDVTNSGVAEFDENNKIISFIEKPKENETISHWVNSAIYYLNPEILKFIPWFGIHNYSDFSKDIFPLLLKNKTSFYGICTDTIVKSFDTPNMLAENNINLDSI